MIKYLIVIALNIFVMKSYSQHYHERINFIAEGDSLYFRSIVVLEYDSTRQLTKRFNSKYLLKSAGCKDDTIFFQTINYQYENNGDTLKKYYFQDTITGWNLGLIKIHKKDTIHIQRPFYPDGRGYDTISIFENGLLIRKLTKHLSDKRFYIHKEFFYKENRLVKTIKYHKGIPSQIRQIEYKGTLTGFVEVINIYNRKWNDTVFELIGSNQFFYDTLLGKKLVKRIRAGETLEYNYKNGLLLEEISYYDYAPNKKNKCSYIYKNNQEVERRFYEDNLLSHSVVFNRYENYDFKNTTRKIIRLYNKRKQDCMLKTNANIGE